MFTFKEFYQITTALEDVVSRCKEEIPAHQARINQYVVLGEHERCNTVFKFLHHKERRIEETRALIFKTEALSRWTEAEKILFPERFIS